MDHDFSTKVVDSKSSFDDKKFPRTSHNSSNFCFIFLLSFEALKAFSAHKPSEKCEQVWELNESESLPFCQSQQKLPTTTISISPESFLENIFTSVEFPN